MAWVVGIFGTLILIALGILIWAVDLGLAQVRQMIAQQNAFLANLFGDLEGGRWARNQYLWSRRLEREEYAWQDGEDSRRLSRENRDWAEFTNWADGERQKPSDAPEPKPDEPTS